MCLFFRFFFFSAMFWTFTGHALPRPSARSQTAGWERGTTIKDVIMTSSSSYLDFLTLASIMKTDAENRNLTTNLLYLGVKSLMMYDELLFEHVDKITLSYPVAIENNIQPIYPLL